MHQHLGLALGLQAVEHALHALGLAREHRVAELKDVVARHIEHRAFDVGPAQHAAVLGRGRKQQGQLLDFLVRGQQIAFHAVGKKLQCAQAFVAGGHLQAHGAQALGNPAGQVGALHGVDLQGNAKVVQRAKPGAGFSGFVQGGQQHHGERRIIVLRALGQLLQSNAAFLARLAAGNADFDNLLVRKQTHAAAGGQHLAPIEVGAHHGVGAALGKALGAGKGAQSVKRFGLQKRLVAVQRVQAFEAALQVAGQLRGGELHGMLPVQGARLLMAAMRRTICCTASVCMSRNSSTSSASLASTADSTKLMSRCK